MTDVFRKTGVDVVDRTGRAVALPADTNGVVAIVNAARDAGWTVAPSWVAESRTGTRADACVRAAGADVRPAGPDLRRASGAAEGAPPSHTVFVSLERLASIHEVVPVDLMAVVGAGVTCGALNERVAADGLCWPGADVSDAGALVGDVVAAAPGNWTRAGSVLRRYVLGMEAVLSNGEVLATGSRTVKWVTGYDLRQLLIGSRGTLGVVTGLTLRLESLANRDALNERYEREFGGLDALGDEPWCAAPDAAGQGPHAVTEAVAPTAAGGALSHPRSSESVASGSRLVLDRLKRELDPDGVFPQAETAFGEEAAR